MIDPLAPDYGNSPADPRRPAFSFAPQDPAAPPVVSIVTPFHRPGAAFAETVRCVRRQSLQQWEWIVVNDASPDRDALAELDALRDSDPRIRVIDLPRNGGVAAARNRGFSEARAEWVFTLDDDDLIEPTALEKCAWYLATHPEAAFVNTFSVGFARQQYLWPRGFDQGAAFLERNYATGRALVRKSAFEAVGGYPEDDRDGFEDWDFWLRAAARGLWGGTIPEYLDWYRRRDDHGDRWRLLGGDGAWDEYRAELRRRYPALYDGGFPAAPVRAEEPYEAIVETPPFANRLARRERRALLVVPWFALGGSDKFTLDVVRELRERGWELTLAGTLDGEQDWLAEFARHTPDVHVLGHVVPHPDQPRYLRYLIESRRPDVVLVTHSELGYLVLPWLRSVCPEPRYLDYTHIEEPDWKSGGYPRHAVAMSGFLDRHLTSSRHLREWMAERGADPERIEVVPTNVDTGRWQRSADARRRLRADWGVTDDRPVIFFAGRLCAQKQPRVLCRTLLELASRGLEFHAVIAGGGEEGPWVEDFLRDRRLRRRTTRLGPVGNDVVADAMSASDVFFLPSRWEGIALSLFEAMAMELAVVAADVGGQRELVTPDCGVLVERGSEDAEVARYADALAALLSDPERCRALGRCARERVAAEFRLDAMADAIERAFASSAEARRATPALDAGLAREWASQTVEYLRACRVSDALWAAGAGEAAGRAALGPVRVEDELRRIELSRAWRTVQRLRRSPLGRLVGASPPDAEASEGDARQRLARIQASRAYRMINALKNNPAYRLYARRRYGPGWRDSHA